MTHIICKWQNLWVVYALLPFLDLYKLHRHVVLLSYKKFSSFFPSLLLPFYLNNLLNFMLSSPYCSTLCHSYIISSYAWFTSHFTFYTQHAHLCYFSQNSCLLCKKDLLFKFLFQIFFSILFLKLSSSSWHLNWVLFITNAYSKEK